MTVEGKQFLVKIEDDTLTYSITLDDALSPAAIGMSCLTSSQVEALKQTGEYVGEVQQILIPLHLWPRLNEAINELKEKLRV
jgi:hypothetical protein